MEGVSAKVSLFPEKKYYFHHLLDMAAAYASLVCLSNLMIQIRNHPRFSTFFDNNQIQYLAQNVEFLLDFVESYNSHGGTTKEEVEDLKKQIASAAYAVEYLTEQYIEDQIVARSSEQKRLAYLLALHKLIVDMDFIKEKVMEVNQKKEPTNSMIAAPSKPLTSGKPTMVGFDDELILLMDLLTRQHSGRIIIPIVGMGGIGKTTLAQNAFEHLLVKQNFDLCLWATISQEHCVRGILLQLLSFMQENLSCETVHELGEQLYKSLCGRRYLIVLDDMWKIDVWYKIKVFFPNNGERNGIIITTRLSSVATHFNSSCIMMKFLDEDKSWKLLCEKAFGEEECPHELEDIGKKIVKKCNGLPLSIVVIGGHLRNSSKTKECWLEVSKDINSVLDSGEDEQCFSILSLSYNHLPTYLKPCFLHIGIFWDEDKEISIPNLVRIWVAEGFLKQSETQSLEEVAMVYIEDLIDRNLILNIKWDQLQRVPVYRIHDLLKVHTLKIHDLLRDLCIRVVEKEMFVSALKLPPQHLKSCCSSDFRSLKIHLEDTVTVPDKFDMVYPWTKFEQVCLRYLDWAINNTNSRVYLHSSVFLLWNLQTLMINSKENIRIMAPSEIWEMPNLRHLLIRPLLCVPDPLPSDQQDHLVLHNLQTLFYVENLKLSEEVCKRIPNIKDLQLHYYGEASSSSYYCFHNLSFFKQLKSLTCDFTKLLKWGDSGLDLPSSLRKLSLRSRNLDWEHLTMIATMVPHLEVLKLNFWDSNIGQFNGEFPCLKSLILICDGDLIVWNVEKSHFPVLNNLTTVRCRLDEIPSGIIEIPTLRKIELFECSVSAAVSAVKVVVEQEELGEEGFELVLDLFTLFDEDRFWEMVEEEDLTSNNVLVMSHKTKSTIRMKKSMP